ncbi:diguanylate cyclase domain-containing protein [Blastomonas sp. SL216]|uniref:diguanylate cyclase domain-containing protein n=1 Tax=Blastomonas sp. SL216 TaxID=2995169 RepID=UPI002376EB2C|nr:diguanylate cyclase [Blastomonas sp. SL216]
MVGDTELARLAALEGLGLLDTPAEPEFDMIAELAQRLLGTKIGLLSLVDRDRQWFKAKIGLAVSQTPRETAFCAHAVEADDVLIVPDATLDSRFAHNPLVTGAPNIRFYAGVPVRAPQTEVMPDRLPMGTLCVIDDQPRDLSAEDLKILTGLALLVEKLFDARSAAAAAQQLAEERAAHLQMLDRKNRQLRQAERMANIGSWRLTLADNRTEWSEQTYAIHGVPAGCGEPLESALEFYPPKARKLITGALERTMATGEPFDVETDFTTAQGEYRRVRSMGELEIVQGKPAALIGVFQDITSRYMLEQALRHAAHTDELTRIASRGSFNEYVDEKIKATTRAGERCALLLIDLDHFKAINDEFGHQAGDELLRVAASRLKADYLDKCFAARLGGDEFVLLVPDQTILNNLPALLRRLLGDFKRPVSFNGNVLNMSATIGASWLGGDVTDRGQLLRNADIALYAAKREQRGSALIAGNDTLIVAEEKGAATLRLVSR